VTVSTESRLDEFEKVARAAIFEAGNLIQGKLGSISFSQVHAKAPFDYVTAVDKESETLIVDRIGKHFPDHYIMSEETSNRGLQDGVSWIIDPLDGTTNFIHGFPFIAVSIAVCEDKRPVLGFVLDPVRQELFSARLGGGAYLNGQRIYTSQPPGLEDALVATGFPHRTRNLLGPYLLTFRSIFESVSGIRRAGAAALDLAYLAAGRVDGFWEAGLKAWDIAAGSLLVVEAGGYVSDFWGTEDYLHNGHVVGGTALVYPFLLEQVKAWLAPALESGAGLRFHENGEGGF
jgi:myo-inositol-1(or 4)-monophosphatase